MPHYRYGFHRGRDLKITAIRVNDNEGVLLNCPINRARPTNHPLVVVKLIASGHSAQRTTPNITPYGGQV